MEGPLKNLKLVDTLIGIKNFKNMINFNCYPHLEAQISSISDDIAYNNHDIQDGYNAKLFSLTHLKEIKFFKNIIKTYPKTKSNNLNIIIYQMVRDSINLMVKNLIKTTILNLKKKNITNINDIYNCPDQIVDFSNDYKQIIQEIRFFLREKMYKNKKVILKNNQGKKVIKRIYYHINRRPRHFLAPNLMKNNKERAIADYISGMTDRYALNIYKSIK